MSEQLTISASYISTMLNLASGRGFESEQLLAEVGIDRDLIERGEPVSALLYGQLHHRIITQGRDEWFGMLSGGRVPEGAIRFLCQSVIHCKTLHDAILLSAEFFELCRGFRVKQVFSVEGDNAVFKIARLNSVDEDCFSELMAAASEITIKSTLVVWHGFVSWLIGQDIPLSVIYYSFADSRERHEVESAGRCPLYFEQDFCGYTCDEKYLHYPIIQREENIEDFLLKAPYFVFIKSDKEEQAASQRVKAILARRMGELFPNAPEVADDLNMSVTTLHRRLSKEGTTFQQIKDEARMEAAIHYLSSPDLNTATIAELVGFENPSTFQRSFKKWTGLPPGEYRKRLMEA